MRSATKNSQPAMIARANRFCSAALALLLVLGFQPVVSGEISNPEPAVRAAQAAVSAETDQLMRSAIRTVAKNSRMSPWIVLDVLVSSGRVGAVEAYAEFSKGSGMATEALRWVEKTKRPARRAASWDALIRARRERLANHGDESIAAIRSFRGGESPLEVLRLYEHARCLLDASKQEGVIKIWASGVALAQRLGWDRAYRDGLRRSAFDAAFPRSPAGGRNTPSIGARQALVHVGRALSDGAELIRCFEAGGYVFTVHLRQTGLRAELVGEFSTISKDLSELVKLGPRSKREFAALVDRFAARIRSAPVPTNVSVWSRGILSAIPFEAVFSDSTVERVRLLTSSHVRGGTPPRRKTRGKILVAGPDLSTWREGDPARLPARDGVEFVDTAAGVDESIRSDHGWDALIMDAEPRFGSRLRGFTNVGFAWEFARENYRLQSVGLRFVSGKARADVLVFARGPAVCLPDRQATSLSVPAFAIGYCRGGVKLIAPVFAVRAGVRRAFLSKLIAGFRSRGEGEPMAVGEYVHSARKAIAKQLGGDSHQVYGYQLWVRPR